MAGWVTTPSRNKIEVSIVGEEWLRQQLRQLPVKLQKRYLRAAMRTAGSFIAKQAKQNTPKRKPDNYVTGTLRRSLGPRVYTSRDGVRVGFVAGPRKNMGRWVVRETKGKRHRRRRSRAVGRKEDWSQLGVKRRWADPTKYGHLVENEVHHKSGKTLPAQPYLEPALKNNEGIVLAIIRGRVRQCINNARAKGQL